MKNKSVFLLFALLLPMLLFDCKKSSDQAQGAMAVGTVIGFDQCVADPLLNESSGYVIKIDSISDIIGDSDVIDSMPVIDTATTYNLPDIFTFAPGIFDNYEFDYLFPENYRDSYKFRFSYTITPDAQKIVQPCSAAIFTGSYEEATKGIQITIKKVYNIIQ